MKMLRKTIPILLIALGVGALPLRAGILEQLFYDGIPGNDVQDLKDAPGFPDAFDAFGPFDAEDGFATLRAQGDNYGSLIKGYIMSPVTGTVSFSVASDDSSELSLSTDETPGGLQLIASKTPSASVGGSAELVEGSIYYFEAIYKDGTGGDYMDVSWLLPDGTQEIIPSGFLFPATQAGAPVGGAPVFAQEPFDSFVDEGAPLTLTGHVSGAQPMTFQWKKNGANIAGATFAAYTFAAASVADDFAVLQLEATNASGSVESFGATLFVTPDTTVPEVKSADDRGNVNAVSIFFSEPIAEAGALNKSSYSIDGGAIAISEIMLSGNKVANGVGSPGATRVTITTAEAFEDGSDHTIRISGIQDLANTPNPLATVTVSFSVGSTGDAPDLGPGTIGEGLVAHWGFEGDFLDDVGEFHGTPMGTGNHDFVDGPDGAGFGSALHLDGGDDYVEITGGDENDLEMAGGDLSISGWFRVGGFDKNWQALIAKGEGGRWRVHRRSGGNVLDFTGGGAGDTGDTGPNVNDGEWHHFVAIATEGGISQLYIDGEFAAAETEEDSLQDSDVNVQIGGNPDTGNRTWYGDIYDIGIWNRPLDTDDVEILFNNSITAILGGGGALGPVGIAEDGDLPESVLVAELVPFEIKIEVTGPGPFAFQWLRNGDPIAGETSRTYSIPSITADDAGDISVLVQNEFSEAESSTMVMEVVTDLESPVVDSFEGSASFDRAT
ncbi:MAG TPA: hypothetical protein EYG38_03050, partial [Verrucomicrobia bacterium]|nr:hypothetical protein [Verrucomicrobiota bacterium]